MNCKRLFILPILAILCVSDAATQDSEDRWGEESGGLRCRWLVPELTTTTAYPPPLVLYVENVSGFAMKWKFSGVCLSIDTPPQGGGLLPEGCLVIAGNGVRTLTEKEVSAAFGVGRGDPDGPTDDPMTGFYQFEPGGRLMLIIPIPWEYRSRLDVGEHKIYAQVLRRDFFSGLSFVDDQITCPALTVKVTKP